MKKLFAFVALAGLGIGMIGCGNEPAPAPKGGPAPGADKGGEPKMDDKKDEGKAPEGGAAPAAAPGGEEKKPG